MSNYRIYLKDTQVPWSHAIWHSQASAEQHMRRIERENPPLTGRLEVLCDLEQIMVRRGASGEKLEREK